MKIEHIRDLLDAQPFQAFVLHTADGRAIPVPHPDFALITHGGRTLVVNSAEDDSLTFVDVLLVPRVEVPANKSVSSTSEPTQQPS